jgi:hypothetical protein
MPYLSAIRDRRHNLETIPRLVETDLAEFRGYGACPQNSPMLSMPSGETVLVALPLK